MHELHSEAVGPSLRAAWRRLARLPGGRALFSLAVGWAAPYTGTLGAHVLSLRPGHATIRLRDRARLRNHLRSVHAIALANLGEMATGLAMTMGLPDDARGILTGLSIDYVKKARGDLTASCTCDPPSTSERREYDIEGDIRDASGEVVARVRARWLVGPLNAAID